MSRWFRHYAGMMRDDKLVRVAIRSKQTIERVAWIWGAILESAAEIDEDGRYDLDAPEIAYFLRADQSDVDAILGALSDAGRVAGSRVVKWGDRQFQSDRSNARVAAHRERKRSERGGGNGQQAACNDEVTLQERHCNSPETETELDTELVKTEAKASSKKRRSIPTDWQPAPFAIGSESRKVVDSWPPGEQPAQVEQFKAHHRSKHNTFLDPQDAWSTWVLNTRKWGIGRHERSASPTVDAASRILRDLRANDPARQDPYAGGSNVHDDGAAGSLVARGH